MAHMNTESHALETEGVLTVARLMAVAARTAPKGKGVDELETLLLTGTDKDTLADAMQRLGESQNLGLFVRDAGNVRASHAVLLLGTRNQVRNVPHCGFCGHGDCAGCQEAGGICSFCVGDLGIAVGSAVSVAADHRVDCRVMFTIGKIAMEQKLFSGDIIVAYGIPLSVTSKSPFFDRK